MAKKKKTMWNKDLGKIFLTALITSIFTLGSSYFLMFSQLEKEQEYWITRLKTERLQELLDREIQLFEEINNSVLISEALAKDFKIAATKYQVNIEMTKSTYDSKYLDKNESLENKGLEYHKHLNNLASKLQMAEFYFGTKVDSLIQPLSNALELNYTTNLINRDSIDNIDIDKVLEYFNRDFNTIEELSNKRMEILRAMRTEMDLVAEYLYDIN